MERFLGCKGFFSGKCFFLMFTLWHQKMRFLFVIKIHSGVKNVEDLQIHSEEHTFYKIIIIFSFTQEKRY